MIDNNSTPTKQKRIQHRMRKTAEYRTWAAMKTRCYNSKCINYKYYGGRGIQVCDRWKNDFTAFYEDMGAKPSPRHSIDRIDCEKDYEPSNCRWATIEEQRRNKRNSYHISYGGETLSIPEWAKRIGIKTSTLRARLFRYNLTIEDALTRPVQ